MGKLTELSQSADELGSPAALKAGYCHSHVFFEN
jgi:hypothetical protein